MELKINEYSFGERPPVTLPDRGFLKQLLLRVDVSGSNVTVRLC
jgi:hypothetical protein